MKLHDESIEYVIELAEDAIMDGDCQKGKGMLESILMEEPGYARAHASLAWMYQYYMDNDAMASRYYSHAIHFDPSNRYAYEQLMELYMKNRMYRVIELMMKKAMKHEGIPIEYIQEILGRAKEGQGEYKEAISYYRKVLMSCMDNEDMSELKKNIRRCRFKRLRTMKILPS